MADLISTLRLRDRRGSKPRCHLLTHGDADEVAVHLTSLIAPWGTVTSADRWMPQGFDVLHEAELHRADRLLDASVRSKLRPWWLAVESTTSRTPNWDIASTCTIAENGRGLVLIEAKAHDNELAAEAKGKPLGAKASESSARNHDRIQSAIAEACSGLNAVSSGWGLSRDVSYQMANRFAWAWKLTELGVPVILVYLGFLNAHEMQDRGRPIPSHDDWEKLVKTHSDGLVPQSVWESRLTCHAKPLIPLIRSVEVPLPHP